MRRCAITLAFALALVAACSPGPDFVTEHGVAFYLQGSTFIGPDEANAQEARFLARLDAKHAFAEAPMRRCIARATVQIVPTGKFPCTRDPRMNCAGEQNEGLLRVAAADCAYKSAFVHELTHWLQECVDRRDDYDHLDPVWTEVDAELTSDAAQCPPQ